MRLWPYACQHWCFSENTRAIEGDCSYRRRFGRWSKAKQIPFGALVDFLPPEQLRKTLPKMGTATTPGVFLGWKLHPGGKWSGDYLCSPLCDWDNAKTHGKKVRVIRTKIVDFDPNLPVEFPMGAIQDQVD